MKYKFICAQSRLTELLSISFHYSFRCGVFVSIYSFLFGFVRLFPVCLFVLVFICFRAQLQFLVSQIHVVSVPSVAVVRLAMVHCSNLLKRYGRKFMETLNWHCVRYFSCECSAINEERARERGREVERKRASRHTFVDCENQKQVAWSCRKSDAIK